MPDPVQVATKPVQQPKVGENGYVGFTPGRSEVLPKGWNGFNGKALISDIRVDHDVEVVVRDGARLYCDVYRPANSSEKVPAILSWSFYGKKYSALDMLPVTVWKCGVKDSDLSGLEKFEGLDPQHWCPRGYAIVSVDTRGAGHSDGHICVMGTQDAEDGYDVVEAMARMEWCNGSVGMAGNSALAIAQWFIAAQQPPSLKAIAPWEGMADMYREQFCRGGWFSMSNFDLIAKLIVRGPPNSGLEDYNEMYRRSPTQNAYWKNKRVDFSKVTCPTFIRGSDVSSIHTMGSVRAWLQIPHNQKWIQWGSKQEWYELYSEPESMHELGKFFDHYLRNDKSNDWLSTPKVRWSALQMGDRNAIDNIVLPDFPVPATEYRELFLQSNGSLSDAPETSTNIVKYDSEDRDSVASFNHTFTKPTRVLGLPKATVYVSNRTKNDFTVFVILRKKDKNGKLLMHLQIPLEVMPYKTIDEIPPNEQASTNLHLGSVGILRASQRRIDSSQSIHPQFPFHPHDKQEFIEPGTVVKLEIGIWTVGVDFQQGETINLQIGGQYPSLAEFKSFSGPRPEHEQNKGVCEVHVGGEYASSVILPIIQISESESSLVASSQLK